MQLAVLFVLLIFSQNSITQEESLDTQVKSLKTQIAQSEKGKKLKLLDSLTYLVEFNEDYNYSKLAEETVSLAIELDSLSLATKLTADQIYYHSSVLHDFEEGIALFHKFQEVVTSHIDASPRVNLHLYTGDCYAYLGKFDEALEQFEIAYDLAKNSGNQGRKAIVLSRMGTTKSFKGQFAGASQDLREANNLFTELKDTLNLITTKTSLSMLYSQNAFYAEAQKEREEAITLNTKNDGSLYGIYYNASTDALLQGDLEQSIINLEKSLSESEKSPNKDFVQPSLLNILAKTHSIAGNLEEADSYFKIIENDLEKYTNGRASPLYIEAKKHYAFAKGEYTQALKLGKQHLTLKKQENAFGPIINAENFLAKTYTKLGNTPAANTHKNEYYRIKDSVTNAQNVKSLAYYQTLYETEKRDLKIAAQSSDLKLLETRNKIRTQWFVIAGIIAVLLLLIIFLRNRYEQKFQKRLAVEQLRTKISADLHDDVGSLLTGLAMHSEILERQAPEELKPKLKRVGDLSREAMLKMRDAVWAMDSRKDNWHSLIDRINEFASETFQTKEIQYTLEEKNLTNQESLTGPIRQHLYLVAKEAVTNTIKHSNASSAVIKLEKTRTAIVMHIQDNGTTILKKAIAGQGLSNMKGRIKQLEGDLSIDTTEGYQIKIKVPA